MEKTISKVIRHHRLKWLYVMIESEIQTMQIGGYTLSQKPDKVDYDQERAEYFVELHFEKNFD